MFCKFTLFVADESIYSFEFLLDWAAYTQFYLCKVCEFSRKFAYYLIS